MQPEITTLPLLSIYAFTYVDKISIFFFGLSLFCCLSALVGFSLLSFVIGFIITAY